MLTQLTHVNYVEIAQHKARFLLAVQEAVVAARGTLDLEAGVGRAMEHIAKYGGIEPRDPARAGKMMARFILGLNLGLEYATKGEVTKGVTALSKNPVERIYLVGERLLEELGARAEQVAYDAVIHVKIGVGGNESAYFGITDAATEKLLRRWVTVGFNDDFNLPPGNMDEYRFIAGTLDRVTAETKMAELVNWQPMVLNHGVTRFANLYYRRRERNTPSSSGGLLAPFLRSLGVNATTSGWNRRVVFSHFAYDAQVVETHLYMRPETVREFMENILSNGTAWLASQETLLVERMGTLFAKRNDDDGRIFKQAIRDQAAQAILTAIDQAMETFYASIQTFVDELQGRGTPQEIKPEDLDDYWLSELDAWARKSLFVYTEDDHDRRAAQSRVTQEPWLEIQNIERFDHLLSALDECGHWGLANCMIVAEALSVARWVGPGVSAREKAERVVEVWKRIRKGLNTSYPIPLLGVAWNVERSTVLEIAARTHTLPELKPWTTAIAQQCDWRGGSIEHIIQERNEMGLSVVLGVILQQVGAEMTERNWRATVRACAVDIYRTDIIWTHMPREHRVALLTEFDSYILGQFFNRFRWSEIESIVQEAIEASVQRTGGSRAFRGWANPRGNRELFSSLTSPHYTAYQALINHYPR